MSEQAPPDQAARSRIADDLDATLFVEAGAGAGKTSSLVARIVNLIESGVPITGIAAITFTEKAAAELRARVRQELSRAPSPLAAAAIERLDHAPIGTLHAFARRLLFEFPIEAGLPPGFTVLDELESALAFDEQWEELLDRLLDEPSPAGGALHGGRTLVELCEFDGFAILRGVRRIADDFRANWDLVAERVSFDDPGELVVDVDALVAVGLTIAGTEVPDGDGQARHVAQISAAIDALGRSTSLRTTLELVSELDDRFGSWTDESPKRGNQQKWKAAFGATEGPARLATLKSHQTRLGELASALMERVKHHRRMLLGAIIGQFVVTGADERARSGRLEFHDLLVIARRLLATDPHVRRLLHERYPRVLLDEFQDTDPIQLEIAVRLTAAPDDPAQTASWRELRPIPGRLFIVGDPKQSIYRFRRADIAQYLRAAGQVGADTVSLSANFRSTSAVIDFVNDVFARLIQLVPDAQPAFATLDACRRPELLGHGTVSILGGDRHDDLESGKAGTADELRAREAADVAAAITTALREGWPIVDRERGEVRACRPGDICVLLPTRLTLPALEASLQAADIAYRAENASVVYATSEVRDLLMVLRAADDPTDELAIVAALRSPLYGCSDVELWEWVDAGGSWSLWAEAPEPRAGGGVAAAIAHLRSIAERVGTHAPADLLTAIAEERRAFDLALVGGDARDTWRRLRFVIEQARAWADAGGHGVRRYRAWAAMQAAASRVADTILPEDDHDAVSVMTVHAAKGLEFPITIVAGMTTKPKRSVSQGVVWANGTWMLAGKGDEGVFDEHEAIDEQMSDAERRRLLYVACTRAVDHLVVSLHRGLPPRNADGTWQKLTAAELLHAAGAADPSAGATLAAFEQVPVSSTVPGSVELDWADEQAWTRARGSALAAAGRRTAVAATRLSEELRNTSPGGEVDDPGLDKRPVNVELPPWQRGRYGTSIGRAVHGVLQFCDLRSGDDIDTLARAQCAAEGVLGREHQVAALARSALAAPIVTSTVDGAEHWRELFVAATVGDRVLEGYVDLLVRTPAGLVIVDYKTDSWSGPVQTAERIGRYRLQLAAYGAALQRAIDEPIVGGVLVHCVEHGPAEQIDVEDWSGALDEVRVAVGR